MTDAFEGAELFAGLSGAAFDDLRRLARPFATRRGDRLFRQGDPPSGLFVLGEGALEIATRIPGDEEARVSRIEPGEVVGEFALLDPGPRSATVLATADARGLFLPAQGFMAMLAEGRPGAIEAVDRLRALVASRTRATLDRLAKETIVAASELRAAPSGRATRLLALEPAMLRSLPRFAALADAAVDELLAAGSALSADRGSSVVPAGEPATELLLVLRGALRASFERDGRHEQLTVLGPGEVGGLVPAFDGAVQPLALSAAEDSIFLALPVERFVQWRQTPGVAGQALLDGIDRQLVRDQRRANRHLGRALALDRFNAVGRAA